MPALRSVTLGERRVHRGHEEEAATELGEAEGDGLGLLHDVEEEVREREAEQQEGEELALAGVLGLDVFEHHVDEELVAGHQEHQDRRRAAHGVCGEEREVALVEDQAVGPFLALVLLSSAYVDERAVVGAPGRSGEQREQQQRDEQDVLADADRRVDLLEVQLVLGQQGVFSRLWPQPRLPVRKTLIVSAMKAARMSSGIVPSSFRKSRWVSSRAAWGCFMR